MAKAKDQLLMEVKLAMVNDRVRGRCGLGLMILDNDGVVVVIKITTTKKKSIVDILVAEMEDTWQ